MHSPTAQIRWRLKLLIALFSFVALPACNSLDAHVYNLNELHHDDGRVSYSAALMGDGEYLMRRAFAAASPLGEAFDFADKDQALVNDPSTECLELLLNLERFPTDGLRVLALKTEMYSWLAVGDPYILSRERCVLELGAIGRTLNVTRPISAPTEAEEPTAEELSGKLADLIEAFAAQLDGGESDALAEACTALGDLNIGIMAGRRILRTGAVLLDSSGSGGDDFEPVRQLIRDVAFRMTSIALGTASNDQEPIVRAASIRAWVEASGNRAGELLLAALRDQHPLVMHQLMRSIAEHGLPQPEQDLGAEQALDWNRTWISNLVMVTRTPLNGDVSIAACQALNKVTDAGIDSLRSEDWVFWWEQRQAAEIGDDRVRRVEP
ncbi:MAG: hypothetical protein ACI8TQ_002343 [Planctomycetota bacterium]|jgi:hypothetical protein